MATSKITVYVRNKDPRKVNLEVTTIDNYASDPVPSDPVTLKHDDRCGVELTAVDGHGSIDWTARAKGYPDGGPETVSKLSDEQEVPVTAG